MKIKWFAFFFTLITVILCWSGLGQAGLIGSLIFALPAGLLLPNMVIIPQNEIWMITLIFTDQVVHLLQPGLHLVFQPFEKIASKITTLPQQVRNEIRLVTSSDGIPFKVNLWVEVQMAPQNVSSAHWSSVLPYLVQNPHQRLSMYLENCLRNFFGQNTACQLLKAQDHLSLRRRLFQYTRQELWTSGFILRQLVLSEILPPTTFQDGLVSAQTRQVEAVADISAMDAFRQGTSTWAGRDRSWLTEIERIRAIRTGNLSTVYPVSLDNNRPSHSGPASENDDGPANYGN